MRITQDGLTRQLVSRLQEQYSSLANVERQVSTGLLIENPSEDPSRASNILTASSAYKRGTQYLKNANSLFVQLQTTESAVQMTSELVSRSRASAIEGANSSVGQTGRDAIANEINGEIEELLRIANQRYGGRYLFGGSNATDSPYTAVRDENGEVTSVTPPDDGTSAPLEQNIEEGVRIAGSISPGDLFDLGENDDLFKALIDARDALRSGDTDKLNDALGRLEEGVDLTTSATSLVGTRASAAQNTIERLTAAQLESEKRLSELSDADAVETMTRYTQEQAAYEMTLKVAARVIEPSLVDFL